MAPQGGKNWLSIYCINKEVTNFVEYGQKAAQD